MARETCVEITFKVPLDFDVDYPTAYATAAAHATDIDAHENRELAGVALIVDARRLEFGDQILERWKAGGELEVGS